MNFQRRLFIAFVAPVVLLLIGLVGSIDALNRTQSSLDHFVHNEQAINSSLQAIHTSALQRGQSLRNLILDTGNPETQKSFELATKAYEQAFRQALEVSADTPFFQKVQGLEPLVKAYSQAQKKVLDAASAGAPTAIQAITADETPAWQSLRAALMELSQDSMQASRVSHGQVNSAASRAQWMAFAMTLGAIVLSAGLGWMVRQTLRREIGGDPGDAKVTLKRIAEGDLTGHIPPAQAEESLMAALVSMQSTMRTLISKIRAATDNIGTASTEIAMGNQDLSSRTEQTASNLEAVSYTHLTLPTNREV